MNNSENKLQEIVRRIKENKKQHRRIRLYMTILSCVVFLLVFWQLRGTGIALLRDSAGVATSTDAEKKEIHGEPEDIRESGTVTVEKNKENETGRNINDEKIDSKTSDKADDIFEDEKLNTKETSSEETEEASEEESEEPEKVEYESESESGIRVRISASTDAFPEGTDVRVEDVPEDMAMEIAEAGVAELNSTDGAEPADDEEADGEEPDVSTSGDAEAVESEPSEQEVEIHSAVGVDITFISPEGEEIEPKEGSNVDVSILLPEESEIDNENLCLLHQVDEETIEHIEDAKVEDEEVVFTTESFSIYVMTKLGPKDKDQVHETLRDPAHGVYFVPNGDYSAAYFPNADNNDGRYIIYMDDYLELMGIGNSNSMQINSFKRFDHDPNDIVEIVDTSVETLSDGSYKVIYKLHALYSGNVRVDYDGQSFYMHIKYRDEDAMTGHHADIEVADGGHYNESTVKYENGKKITTVTSYSTFVTKVNESRVLDENGNLLTTRAYYSDDYEQQGSPGDTQYELTAAWKGNDGKLPTFVVYDVDSVVFDVNLEFIPESRKTIIENTDGTTEVINSGVNDVQPLVLNNVIFNMDRTSVIDAYNKCPNHSGLDFNIKYTRASVVLSATKEFVGGTLSDGQFAFEVLDEQNNNKVIGTASNDKDGNILFPRVEYEAPGNYKYLIRENPGNNDSYKYDESIYEVVVHVDYNVNGDLEITNVENVDGKIPTFTNYVKYTLPSTGGIGIYPYIILGIILCGASLLLLILTRRRGSG